jgi:hypothetical protein
MNLIQQHPIFLCGVEFDPPYLREEAIEVAV